MSTLLVSRSLDLQRLRDEGYDIEIRGGQLLVKQVPYVTKDREIDYGTLVSELTTQGNATAPPESHQMWFIGQIPCDAKGVELDNIISDRNRTDRGSGLIASCAFSTKPPSGKYANYYEKATRHVHILEHQAQAIDPAVTARVFAPITPDEDSVFQYLDSASSRAGIGAVSQRLAALRIAIVGVGGTGAYILDLVSKTHVREIHIFDDDVFQTHNAFRTPGAAKREELDAAPSKVDYLKARYQEMHRGIVAHRAPVDEENVDELQGFDFVFLAIEVGSVKKAIIEALERLDLKFIDVGMGVQQKGTSLRGQLRTTTSTPRMRNHIWDRQRVDFADLPDDIYEQNIQIADLNMLNAALAVVRWKKLFGFYLDTEDEHWSSYIIDGNFIVNEEKP